MNPAIVKVNERQKSVALESITHSRDAVAWKLDNESKYLAEYKQQYENQQAKVDKLLDELFVLNDLIAAFGGKEDNTVNLETTSQRDNPAQVESKEAVEVELAESHKRIQYPSSPKEKLKELILSGTHFKTDEELHFELERTFNISNIPKKTVINYLIELRKENVIRRYKSVAHGTFLSGSSTWVNNEGIPLKEYWPEP